jgi:hypothetical protein
VTQQDIQHILEWLKKTLPTHQCTFINCFGRAFQSDNWSCGPYVCFMAERLSEKKKITRETIKEVEVECLNLNVQLYRHNLLQFIKQNIAYIPDNNRNMQIKT